MDNVIIFVSFGVTTVFLFLCAWFSICRGKLYGVLFGGLGIYGFFTFEQIGTLSEAFSVDVIGTAALVYAAGSVVLVLSIVAFESTFPYRDVNSVDLWVQRMRRSARDHTRWATIASCIALVLLLHTHSNLSAAWDVARAANGFETSVAAFFLLLGTPGIASAVIRGKKFLALSLLVINMVSFVLLGSRAAMLGALGFWVWIVFMQQRSRLKQLRILIVIVFLGFCAQVVLRFIRGLGLDELLTALSSGDIFSLFISSPVTRHISGGEAAVAKYFMFSVELAPSGVVGFMTSIHRLALFFIPYSVHLIPKPMDVTYQLWAAAYSHGLFAHAAGAGLLRESYLSGDYGSLHPTLFGEMFVSGQWPSLIISVVLVGALCVFIDRCLKRMSGTHALLVLGPTIVGLLFVARGNSVIGFGYFIYLAIFVVIAGRLIKFLRMRAYQSRVEYGGGSYVTQIANTDGPTGVGRGGAVR